MKQQILNYIIEEVERTGFQYVGLLDINNAFPKIDFIKVKDLLGQLEEENEIISIN